MINLSIVIPAYNEERRLSRTLDSLISFLQQSYKEDYEIIVVDDGSTDATSNIVKGFLKQHEFIRLVEYGGNHGRGYAVREGIKTAKGEYILETDADGSVDEEAIVRFLDFFKHNPQIDVLIGSRNAEGAEILTAQPLVRVILGEVFLFLAKLLFDWSITDFTLGFKMFRRNAAFDIFMYQIENSYIAEAEIIVVSKRRGWVFRELPVAWKDYRDSRVRVVRASINSLAGLVNIYYRIYKDKE